MTVLPIVGRELRLSARRSATYWLRAGVAVTVIIVSAWIFLISLRDPAHQVAEYLFYTLTGGALAYCLVAGTRSTADCLSEEKREGTLGLLFLTDLKGFDVVLGKLAASSIGALYGILAIVPVLGIPLLLGGISPGEFLRVALVLVNTLFFSLCLGIFVSALFRSQRVSVGTTFLLILLFTAGFPAAGSWLEAHERTRAIPPGFLVPSPVYSYFQALDIYFKATTNFFYCSMAVIQGIGWVCLALASLIAPRSWQDRPPGAAAFQARQFWTRWSQGTLSERKAFRARLLAQNAYYWLAARSRSKPAWVWGVFAVLAAGWAWGAIKYGRDWFSEPIYIATGFTLNSILKVWVGSEAMRQVSEDRKMGTLELLLTTPLKVGAILNGQLLALKRQFLGPLLVALFVEVLMMVWILHKGSISDARDRHAWIATWTVGIFILVADLWALYWQGMWLGLAARNARRAYTSLVWRILVLPWVAFAGFLSLVALASISQAPDVPWWFFMGVWFGLGLLADLGFGLWARSRLLTEFRVAATLRYAKRKPLWKRLPHSDFATASQPPRMALRNG